MPDILQDLPIRASAACVFRAVSAPAELDQWWTIRSSGVPRIGARYDLWFGPDYDWAATVTRCLPAHAFEFELVRADAEWTGTKVGFELEESNGRTLVRFQHLGWPSASEHYRISCHSGRCTCEFCDAISSTGSACRTSNVSTCDQL
jgi:uncharacterized protein YndB with AHSA1/START domain